MLEELLIEYVERFGGNFPTFMMRGQSEDDLIQILKSCLQNGTPYETENCNPRDALY